MKEFIGGKDVISRIMEAYGFANRRLLAEHLGMPHSTLALGLNVVFSLLNW